jgi:hypothetical protein
MNTILHSGIRTASVKPAAGGYVIETQYGERVSAYTFQTVEAAMAWASANGSDMLARINRGI